MIGFWTYVIIVVPCVVLVLTIGLVYWSKRDGVRITELRAEAAELRRRAFDITTRPTTGQATASFGSPELGSEAYRRAAERAQSPTY